MLLPPPRHKTNITLSMVSEPAGRQVGRCDRQHIWHHTDTPTRWHWGRGYCSGGWEAVYTGSGPVNLARLAGGGLLHKVARIASGTRAAYVSIAWQQYQAHSATLISSPRGQCTPRLEACTQHWTTINRLAKDGNSDCNERTEPQRTRYIV